MRPRRPSFSSYSKGEHKLFSIISLVVLILLIIFCLYLYFTEKNIMALVMAIVYGITIKLGIDYFTGKQNQKTSKRGIKLTEKYKDVSLLYRRWEKRE